MTRYVNRLIADFVGSKCQTVLFIIYLNDITQYSFH